MINYLALEVYMRGVVVFLITMVFFAMPVLASAQIAAPSGFLPFQGGKLEYFIEGQGIPFVVLSGPHFYQRLFSPELRKHIQFIFYDSRITVPTDSTMDWSKVNLDTLIDDIERLRVALGIEKIGVIGHSLNAAIAAEYARKYPDHVSHVIMIGASPLSIPEDTLLTNAYWDSSGSAERKRICKENWEKIPMEKIQNWAPSDMFRQIFLNDAPKYWYDPRFEATQVTEGCFWNLAGVEQTFGVILGGDYTIKKRGGKISAPVFLALGKYDYSDAYFEWDGYLDIFENVSYNLFEKSGHMPMHDEQALFDQKLISWLKNN
jgi:proline iminopeptidase